MICNHRRRAEGNGGYVSDINPLQESNVTSFCDTLGQSAS